MVYHCSDIHSVYRIKELIQLYREYNHHNNIIAVGNLDGIGGDKFVKREAEKFCESIGISNYIVDIKKNIGIDDILSEILALIHPPAPIEPFNLRSRERKCIIM